MNASCSSGAGTWNPHPRPARGVQVCNLLGLLSACVGMEARGAENPGRPLAPTSKPAAKRPDASFFRDCAFVCVDIQPSERKHITQDQLPKAWKAAGFTAQDVNAATDYAHDVAFPNAAKIANACRRLKLPMVFIHWGSLFEDGMDLDPHIRKSFIAEHGPDCRKWPHTKTDPSSRPADFLRVRKREYVIPKTGQDAFTSSNLGFVLRNLGVRHLIFVGGHAGACLGKTARSAKKLGLSTLCIEDATFDARESSRGKNIIDTGYDHVMATADFLALIGSMCKP